MRKVCSRCARKLVVSQFAKKGARLQSLCRDCASDDKLLRRYGLTREEYQRKHDRQLGKCAICRTDRKLFVDHDHSDGSVRGLLCDACNRGLGFFREDPSFLFNAVEYLEVFR